MLLCFLSVEMLFSVAEGLDRTSVVLAALCVEVSEGARDTVSSKSILILCLGDLQIYLRETLGLQYVAQLLKLRKGSADDFTQQKVKFSLCLNNSSASRAHDIRSSHIPAFRFISLSSHGLVSH